MSSNTQQYITTVNNSLAIISHLGKNIIDRIYDWQRPW